MSTPEVQSYALLRENLAQRDRSLREKVMSLSEAASFVQDGMTIGVGGSTMSRTPMAMIWELIRQGRRSLTAARCIVSTDGDLLIGSGVADEIVTSWFAQGILWGLSKVMRHHVESGEKRFQEWSHMAMGMRFRAGAMGVPYMPIRSMLGSDVMKLRPEAKESECPFTGEKLLLVPALNPEVAIIHVQRCDAYGNAQIDGLQFMDIDLAMERGEVQARTGSYTGLLADHPDWIRDKKVRILFQIGSKPDPALKGIPLMTDLARNDEDRRILKLVSSPIDVGRPYLTPPEVPADRVEILREAFQKTLRDKDFLAEMAQMGHDIDPVSADELTEIVRHGRDRPHDARAHAGVPCASPGARARIASAWTRWPGISPRAALTIRCR